MIQKYQPKETDVTISRGDVFSENVHAIVVVVNSPTFQEQITDASYGGHAKRIMDHYQVVKKTQDSDVIFVSGIGTFSDHVIYVVVPLCGNDIDVARVALENCYKRCLELAIENQVRTLAFPNIGEERLGYPPGIAINTALFTVFTFCNRRNDPMDDIRFSLDKGDYEAFLRILKEGDALR